MKQYTLSIIGSPNTGKSTLFNCLLKKKKALVGETRGLTRDRNIDTFKFRGYYFSLVDTGGFQFEDNSGIGQKVTQQILSALEDTDIILFLVDYKVGWTDDNKKILQILRQYNKKFYLVINKVDGEAQELYLAEFYKSGIPVFYDVSALHRRGIDELLQKVVEDIDDDEEIKGTPVYHNDFTVALIGKPNVGKSTFINTLFQEERHIVHDEAGTTRDSIDSTYSFNEKKICFIDTAGIRKKTRVSANVESYSVTKALRSIDRSDMVLLVVDSTEQLTRQDIRLTNYIQKKWKPFILVFNKWDLLKKTTTEKEYQHNLLIRYPHLKNFSCFFISAKNLKNVSEIIPKTCELWEKYQVKIKTSDINQIIQEIIKREISKLKIFYATQVAVKPPTFQIFVNKLALLKHQQSFIENKFRYYFRFQDIPFKIIWKERTQRDKYLK